METELTGSESHAEGHGISTSGQWDTITSTTTTGMLSQFYPPELMETIREGDQIILIYKAEPMAYHSIGKSPPRVWKEIYQAILIETMEGEYIPACEERIVF